MYLGSVLNKLNFGSLPQINDSKIEKCSIKNDGIKHCNNYNYCEINLNTF